MHFAVIVIPAMILAACAGDTEQDVDRVDGEVVQSAPEQNIGCTFADSVAPVWTCNITNDVAIRVAFEADTTNPHAAPRARITPQRGAVQEQMIDDLEWVGDLNPSAVEVRDLDGDGRGELLIRRDIGHPNNSGHDIRFYDPSSRTFVRDSLLSDETNVHADSIGCVVTSGWLGGMHTIEQRYCRAGDRTWQEVWRREQAPDSSGVLIEREYRLVGGQMRLVQVDTVSE